MKAILILCLIASLNCNILEIGMCLFTNGKIISVINEIIKAIKEKNWGNILSIVIFNFEEVKTNAFNCFNEEPILQISTHDDCQRCFIRNLVNPNKCYRICHENNYN